MQISLKDPASGTQWTVPVLLGEVTIEGVDRSFALPPDVDPLGVQLGTVAVLQAAAAELTEDEILIHVVWQGGETVDHDYTTFAHLRDGDGRIVSQVDRPTAPPTSAWVEGQVIRETYRLPRPHSGHYTVALGLYDAASGERLPAYTGSGEALPDAQYVLEVTVP